MEIKAKLLKPYTDKQRIDFIVTNNHKLGYEIKETELALEAWGSDASELLQQAKENKVLENDLVRDKALLQGVYYKDVLFDSDTDQKINLLAIISTIGNEDTIVWYGMDNVPLECNKEDLINIGGLITALHSFCWNKNAELKSEIHEAETIEEVEAIVIDYSKEDKDERIESDTENNIIEQNN